MANDGQDVGFFNTLVNSEQASLSSIKEELRNLSDADLKAIAEKETRTGFFVSGKSKQKQIAAWQLLRERSHESSKER